MRASAKDIFLITVATLLMITILLTLIFTVGGASQSQAESTLDLAYQLLPVLFLASQNGRF